MLQVLTWVRVRCDQCADTLSTPTGQTHHPDEVTAALAATRAGWREDPGGRWWCSACAVVLSCQEWGHEFTNWRRSLSGGTYRYCQRCCLHERRAPGPRSLAAPSDPDDQDALDADLAVREVA